MADAKLYGTGRSGGSVTSIPTPLTAAVNGSGRDLGRILLARDDTPRFIAPAETGSGFFADEGDLPAAGIQEDDWAKIEAADDTSQKHYGARLTAAGWEPAKAFEQGATKHGAADGLANVNRIELDRTNGVLYLVPANWPDDITDQALLGITGGTSDITDTPETQVSLVGTSPPGGTSDDAAQIFLTAYDGTVRTGDASDTADIQFQGSYFTFRPTDTSKPTRVLIGPINVLQSIGPDLIPLMSSAPGELYMGVLDAPPATPDEAIWILYPKSDGYYIMGDDGVEVGPLGAGGGGSLTIEDEGVSQGTATTMNFVGSGVTASVAGSVATVTVSGGGGGGGEPGRSWLGV